MNAKNKKTKKERAKIILLYNTLDLRNEEILSTSLKLFAETTIEAMLASGATRTRVSVLKGRQARGVGGERVGVSKMKSHFS